MSTKFNPLKGEVVSVPVDKMVLRPEDLLPLEKVRLLSVDGQFLTTAPYISPLRKEYRIQWEARARNS